MKQLLFLLLMSISLVSCETPTDTKDTGTGTGDTEHPLPDDLVPGEYCGVEILFSPHISIYTTSVQNTHSTIVNPLPWNKGICFHFRFNNGSMPAEDAVFMDELSELLSSQYKQCSASFNDWMGFSYYYDSITDISITANQPMFGMEVGEELSDMFNVVVSNRPIFSYPDGVLQNPEGGAIIMSVSEWIQYDVMAHSRYALKVKDEFEQEMGDLQPEVTFTISVTTHSGKKAQDSVIQEFCL